MEKRARSVCDVKIDNFVVKMREKFKHQTKCTLSCSLDNQPASRAATRKLTIVGQKYFKGGGKHMLGGEYTEYYRINNNSKNFREARLLLIGASPSHKTKTLPPNPP